MTKNSTKNPAAQVWFATSRRPCPGGHVRQATMIQACLWSINILHSIVRQKLQPKSCAVAQVQQATSTPPRLMGCAGHIQFCSSFNCNANDKVNYMIKSIWNKISNSMARVVVIENIVTCLWWRKMMNRGTRVFFRTLLSSIQLRGCKKNNLGWPEWPE